jgi:uracil-DNA glycosylase
LRVDRLALSALDWWDQAGVDVFVDESPRDWLAPLPAVTHGALIDRAATTPEATPSAAPTFPADLANFRAWLLTDPTIPGRASARFDAMGDPASGTMILLDMPEAEDRQSRTLLSGDVGALFDRMLAAMKLSRDTIYLAPFSPARSPSGSLDAPAIAALASAARHHVKLANPRRLLLMGAAPVRALLDIDTSEARGRVHTLSIDGATLPTVATFPPRFITQASAPDELKARRATVWEDLQHFMAL